MNTVSAYIYCYEQGWPVHQMEVNVYPLEDQRGPYGLSCDLQFEDINGYFHRINDEERALNILADIKKNDPEKWSAIERAAKENSRPDHDEDADSFYQTDMVEA